MRNVTERDERSLGVLAWICDRCKAERQTLEEHPDPPSRTLRLSGGVGRGRHPRDELLRLIRRRRRRWEVRVGGRRDRRSLGLFGSIEEAIRARDAALRRAA